MKRLLLALLFWAIPVAAHAQFSQVQIQYLQTMISQWLAAGSSLGGAGHTIQEDGSSLTQETILNFTGAGITCSDAGGKTVCDVPAGSVDTSAEYIWTGAHSWRDTNFYLLDDGDVSKTAKFELSGISTKTTRTFTLPNADTTLVGTANANTWSTGAQDMGSATSFKVPTSAGAGPTTSGLIAYDSTSNTFEWGANGSNKIALADPGANGFLSRTAAGTVLNRTFSPVSNEIAITNGNGVSGDVTIGLGSLAVQTGKANTYTTGLQDFSAATMAVPGTAGYAPTTAKYIGYNTTTNRFVGGVGSAKVFAFTDEIQPLATNLTALSAITGANNVVPIFSGASSIVSSLLPSCADSGGNHLNYDNTTHVFSCGTSSTGGLSGLTTAKYLIATGATAADTSGALSEAAGVVNAANGLTVGNVAANYLNFDTSAVTGAKTWTVQNFSGTVRTSTGVLTPGNIVTTDANGQLVDGGAAGSGTWTDSSTSVGTNKTLDESSNTLKITKSVQVELFGPTTDTASGNGAYYFRVPASLNGTNLVGIQTNTVTAGTTGLTSVQITRCAAVATSPLCSGTTTSMLTTVVSIDSGETSSSTAATPAAIDTSNDDVATGQILRFDVTAINTTPAKGLIVNLDFKLP